jgi:putative transposase
MFIPGLTHHVVHRGVNRAAVFHSPSDHSLYIRILTRAAAATRVAIHAYALMSNHIHLMATPESERGLSLMMQEVGRIYVPFFNRRYGRTGTLWDGRFRPAVVQTEMYWMTCLRYVELNPVRAGIVARPEDYRWSSYRAHAFGTRDALITPHPLFEALGSDDTQRGEAWRSMCDAPVPEEELVELRYLLATNQIDEPAFAEVQEA